ncbi:hypothetical protein SAMD00019534_088420 [Acytostelium subglobosum LB1]|uniref:hypothetical protein n=1 Tax=Acytostelium subglobosum LB1 TaxID=1410327 RepID=UPI000644E603|nr:hypothetical protein SAMD00019534_088420 [Acytostelium subglobosum LB1]GAM25667.1 hypothetical protein SAMD00019534_088420 [Acytostelium subglobosum LB1]|eukprot:XP_012751185.1 hypothetical protein SAMD00019534_088420 [Acytostelium subglobosum LB1]
MKRISSLYSIGTKYHQTLVATSSTTNINNTNNKNGSNTIASRNGQFPSPLKKMSPRSTTTVIDGTATQQQQRSYFTKTGKSLFQAGNNNNNNSNNSSISATGTDNTKPFKNEVVQSYSLEELLHKATESSNAGRLSDAISELTDAIGLDGADPRAYGYRADLHFHQSKFKEAIQDYKRVLELMPESLPCLSSLAECYASTNDFDTAVKYLRQILAIEPNYLPALGSLSDIYLKQGNVDETLSLCKRIVAIEPSNLSALLQLGHVAFKKNSLDNATKLYEQVIRLAKEKGYENVTRITSSSSAGPVLKLSTEFNPAYSAAICLISIAEVQDNPEKILEHSNLALSIHPNSGHAMTMKASMLLRKKQPEESHKLLLRVLELEPNNQFAHIVLADCLFDLRRTQEALQKYKEVLAEMLERDRPEEINTKVMLLHNMMLAHVTLLNDLPEVELEVKAVVEEELSKEITGKPQNMQELSKKARAMAKVLTGFPAQTNPNAIKYIEFSIQALLHIALTANESLQIRHNQAITLPKEKLLDPLDEIILYYYDHIFTSFGLNDT